MIVVIADDLSGAAELAGAARARGMSAEVQTVVDLDTTAELVAVDTDTRSCSIEQASRKVADVTRRVVTVQPSWIYKKTDSVLRGHVRSEITAMLVATGQSRALLVPANPSRGRLIRDGHYLVDGVPLEQTAFAGDPEYPATSSDVRAILNREAGTPLHVASSFEVLPKDGIIVPDTVSAGDLSRHATVADVMTLCAGGVEFFEALLGVRNGKFQVDYEILPADNGPTLFVCGSATAWPVRRQQCEERGIPVFALPANLMSAAGSEPNKECLLEWLEAIGQGVREMGSGLMAIGDVFRDRVRHTGYMGRVGHTDDRVGHADYRASLPLSPLGLVEVLAEAVALAIQSGGVERLFLEGGATAGAILRRLKENRLSACGHFAPGLPALKSMTGPAPLFAIKPGSYPWPEAVWPKVKRKR